MDILKELAPYLVSIIVACITSGIAYFQAKKGFKTEIEKLEKQHKNELETLVKKHEINIEALKEKHNMEKERKEQEHQHEIELQKLKTQNNINEKNQECMSSAMSSVMGNLFQDVITGKIKPEDLQDLANKFPKKKAN